MNDSSVVTRFLGDEALLNPAYMSPCVYDGDTYPNIIMAVEASKFDKVKRGIFQHGSPKVADMGYARPYTDKQLQVLEQLLRERFRPGTPFYDALKRTGDDALVYTNDAHRNWYGVCTCDRCTYVEHKNYVGKILVRIRDES